MLLFETVHVLCSINQLQFVVFNCRASILKLLFRLVEMLFHVATSSNSLNGKPLLTLQLILEIISLAYELVVLLHGVVHLFNGFISFLLAFESEHSFCSEHARKQC
jgi:hypothetical protein